MAISMKPEHLKRYARLARLLVRYGRRDVVERAGWDELIHEEETRSTEAVDNPAALDLATDLEDMGPTFIKVGQLLSTRVDLVPPAYLEALSRLQDSVDPFPFEQVEEIVTEELGVRLSKAFLEFESQPIAAASLGQVHRARLRDGRLVAVKVQRPGIRQRMAEDLEALSQVAGFLDDHTETGEAYDVAGMMEEMRSTLLRELDYRREATNLEKLAENLEEFDRIMVPLPVEDYTTSRVLTMDFVRGRKITSIGPLSRLEIEGAALAEELFRAYLKQILADGFFHADPHPGNVFITDDGRLALLDVGMIGRIPGQLRDDLLRLLLAVSEARGEDAADVMIRIGTPLPRFEQTLFRRRILDLVAEHADLPADRLQIGRLLLEVTRGAAEARLRVPRELTVLGKTLLNLDQVGRSLDPGFEPNAAVRRNAVQLLERRMLASASPGNFFSSILEMNEFVQRLPQRLNRLLDAVADRQVEVKIRITNADLIMGGLQKIANRIAAGLILAALIVGAAMLMQVETSFRILGYPGFAMLCFLAAAVGGLLLVAEVFKHDGRS